MPIGHYEDTDDYLRRIVKKAKRLQAEGGSDMFIPGKTDVVLKIKRLPETNEWKVQWLEDGVLDEDKSYYTNDHDDAIGTQRIMADEAYQMGARTVEAFA